MFQNDRHTYKGKLNEEGSQKWQKGFLDSKQSKQSYILTSSMFKRETLNSYGFSAEGNLIQKHLQNPKEHWESQWWQGNRIHGMLQRTLYCKYFTQILFLLHTTFCCCDNTGVVQLSHLWQLSQSDGQFHHQTSSPPFLPPPHPPAAQVLGGNASAMHLQLSNIWPLTSW